VLRIFRRLAGRSGTEPDSELVFFTRPIEALMTDDARHPEGVRCGYGFPAGLCSKMTRTLRCS
jgi:hypothetical protein